MDVSFFKTQTGIRLVKETFTQKFAHNLSLVEVQGPILSDVATGFQDNLSGTERAVLVPVAQLPHRTFEVVHSLAKWKRYTLARFGFARHEGLLVQMKALRPEEALLDETHSVYVDQWDWERVIAAEHRNTTYLRTMVQMIYQTVLETEAAVVAAGYLAAPFLPRSITFVQSEDLCKRYPDKTPGQREHLICKELGAVFLMGIGGVLSDGKPHDLRAPDYDDWTSPSENGYKGLNGDILLWNPVLEAAFELSSMGIRVDKEVLLHQLALCKAEARSALAWHQALLKGELPLSIGGGIGQSRLAMLLLQKEHIGMVQSSVWSEEVQKKAGIL